MLYPDTKSGEPCQKIPVDHRTSELRGQVVPRPWSKPQFPKHCCHFCLLGNKVRPETRNYPASNFMI